MLQESFVLIFLMREIEILKNMPFKILKVVTYFIKSLPDNFLEKVANFGGVCFNIKKS